MHESPPMEWVAPIIQLVTAGGFGALVWYLVVKHIPAIEDRHMREREELAKQLSEHADKFEELTREFITVLTDVRAELKALNRRREP